MEVDLVDAWGRYQLMDQLTSPYNHRSVHDEAATRLHEWYNNHMQKNAQPEVIKVGPHGYIHGWIKVGSAESAELQHNLTPKRAAAVKSHLAAAKLSHDAGNADHEAAYLKMAHDKVSDSKAPHLKAALHNRMMSVQNEADRKFTMSKPVVAGDPKNGWGISLTPNKRTEMKQKLIREFGVEDAKPLNDKIDALPNGRVYPTLSGTARDSFLESHDESELPAADSVIASFSHLYGNPDVPGISGE